VQSDKLLVSMGGLGGNRVKLFLRAKPGWRNWQTQRTQNPPRATSWGFDPPSRHQQNKEFKLNWPLQGGEARIVWWLFWWLLVSTVVCAKNELRKRRPS
jgi:hypothetical protein